MLLMMLVILWVLVMWVILLVRIVSSSTTCNHAAATTRVRRNSLSGSWVRILPLLSTELLVLLGLLLLALP